MNNSKNIHSIFAIALILFLWLPSSQTINLISRDKTVTYSNKIYLPLVFKSYKSPPPITISHYINLSQNDLSSQEFFNMGQTLGDSVDSGFWGTVVLQFGEPWMQGQSYGVADYDYFVYLPSINIESLVENYITGFYIHSPTDAFLVISLSITNQGPYFSLSNDPQGFGRFWGTVISDLDTWINSSPSYAGKVAIEGGIDNELAWNNASKSLAWKNGYTYITPKFYYYVGNCASCPYYGNPGLSPHDYGWELDQVYTMAATTNGLALPQIYSKNRVNADQWYYLSLYKYLLTGEPIGFMGALTEATACNERDGCNSGTPDAIDNTPWDGYPQLWGNISSDPRTAEGSNHIPFELPIASDWSWNVLKVRFTP